LIIDLAFASGFKENTRDT
jgi:hypothetical protein